MESWPSSLPQAPYFEFSGQQSSGLLDPDVIRYPARNRTYPEYTKQFSFKQLTVTQFQAFRTWWDVTLNQCAPFSAPWLIPIGFNHHFCRFDTEDPWEATLNGFKFDLTINVELIATMPVENGANAWYLPLDATQADFVADVTSGYVPLTVTFTPTSNSDGIVDHYTWNFGDGVTSTEASPSHTYSAGTYSVSLTVVNASGEYVKTKTAYIVVGASSKPEIDFNATPTSGAAPLTVYFTSTNSGGEVETYDWDFGDGGSSAVANPVHEFISDPYWAETVLAMPMNGTNGSTTFTDLKGHTVTPYGNACISTAQSVSGGSSAYFDGSGDYLSIADSADWEFGTGDFTIEAWIRASSLAVNRYVIGQRYSFTSDNSFAVYVTSGRKFMLAYGSVSGGGGGSISHLSSTIAVDTWTHIAISRVGTVGYIAVNGQCETKVLPSSFYNSTAALLIGRPGAATTNGDFIGHIDNLRITKGVARYTANFTPPTGLFTSQSFTVSLTAGNEAGTDTETKTNYITVT